MAGKCDRCGKCVKHCVLSRMGFLSFAEARLKGRLGEGKWYCSGCGVCADVCPQSLPLLELRYRRGFRPEAKRGGIRLLLGHGYCFPLKEGRINEHREALGLPPLVFAPEEALKTLLAEAAAMAEREER